MSTKALTTKVQDWAGRQAGATAAMEELHNTERQLREQHAIAVKERDTILSAWAPLNEVLANMERHVDMWAAKWAHDYGPSLVGALGPGHERKSDGELVPRASQLPSVLFGPVTFLNLIELAPDLFKKRLADVIRATAYEAGPPAADRARLYAEAAARVVEIERQHTELVDAAAALDPPIALALLPIVAERRTAEAERLRHNAAAIEERQRREAAVNQRHENAGRRSSVSKYLRK